MVVCLLSCSSLYPLRTFGTKGTTIVLGKWQASTVVTSHLSLEGTPWRSCCILLRLRVGFTGGLGGFFFFFLNYQNTALSCDMCRLDFGTLFLKRAFGTCGEMRLLRI